MGRTLVQINTSCNWDAPGRIAEQIGVSAKKKGWDVYFVHGARFVRESELKTIRTQTTKAELFHYAYNSLLKGEQGLGSTRATRKLIEELRNIRPDIVHLHNIHGYYLNYPLLFDYLKEANIPVVWTLHDCWAFTGHCVYFDMVNCEKWKTGCYACPQINTYPQSLFRDSSDKEYQRKRRVFGALQKMALVPVSMWMSKLVQDSFLGRFPTKVIHNGIDLNVFTPTPSKCIDGKYKILGVASGWGDRKGITDFIKLRELLDDQYDITMVGLSEKEARLVPDTIHKMGRTSNLKELVTLYSDADVYVNTTYSDNFPTTNLESLACGTPVITYETGGSPEAIDENTGVVVPYRDIEKMANAIIKMRQRPKSSKACRERAEEFFNKDKCFDEYLQLYEALLK